MTRHPDRWAALVLLAIALMLFVPVVAQPGGLVYPPHGDFSDLTITHWPNAEFAIASLRAIGSLPLWRPTIMSGTPFAANPLSGLFYFPHAVLLVVPLAIGFNVLYIAHVWLAGCGAYALLRAWQVERPAAFIGALTWMATPKLFAHLGAGHVGMVEAVAWMPLAVWAAHRMVESRRVMNGAWLGAVWAVQFLADPRISFYTVALSVTYILIVLVFTAKAQRHKENQNKTWYLGILVVALLAILAFAMSSAVLWLPFIEFIMQSNRGALTLAQAGEWSLPVRQLVSLLLADWSGFHEWTVYVGILPLILGLVATRCVLRVSYSALRDSCATCITQHNLVITWLVICLIVAVLFSLGTNGPLFPILFRFLPGLALLRVPPRAWFIVAFAVAMLSAFGVQVMLQETRKPRSWVTLTGVVLAAFALLFGLGGFLLLRGNAQAALARSAMLHLALVVPASVGVVLLRAHSRMGAREFATCSVAVIVVTLLPVDQSLYRVVSETQAFSDHAEVASWLARQPGVFRVYSPSYSLPQHVAQRAGLELADGVDPMQVANYARLMEAATGTRASGYSVTIPPFPPNSDVRTAWHDARPSARLLGRLNVRYVVAEFPIQVEGLAERARFGTTFVYENMSALPRAFVGEGTAARVTTLTPDRIVLEADGPGALTLSQVYYPGWYARVDGRAVPIEIVDSALMGVSLEAGPHIAEFTFDPWTVKFGLLVSSVGWSGLLLGALVKALKSTQVFRGQRWNHAGK